ncbi:MAG: branched-chain amino acid ABC transporter permease [Geobacteraceae bacterium]|nr:branched-chain amino acid ABC transporter permease [Geobacteraceae bacterium]
MNLSDQIIQFLLSGFATGAIYALIGLGFSIIYNSTGIINFAQGEFVMLGGMVTMFFLTSLHLPLPAALVGAVAITTVVGVLFERLAIRPIRKPTPLNLVIITIGGSILIRGLAMLVWGKDTHAIPGFSGEEPIQLGNASLLPQHLWIFGITTLVIIVSKVFFNYTISGKAMRACAFNPRAASLIGIDVRRMVLFSFIISSAMGSMAGFIIAPLTMTSYDVGIMLGLKGFCAAIIGGMSSGLGTVFGGIILGILESLGAGLISSGYKDAVAFVILLLILFIRPQGIFKRADSERV